MRLIHAGSDRTEVERWAGLFTLSDDVMSQVAADEFVLRYLGGQLYLHKGMDPVGIGVDEQVIARRRRGKFALAQACGDTAAGRKSIFDATAGLGTDLLALYARGFQMQAMELHPVLLALLDSYLSARAITDIPLHLGDATAFLEQQGPRCYDVVYLDPMFPEGGKSALPGKRMQYLRELLDVGTGAANDPMKMLAVARRAAKDRVVLKRRRRDPLIDQPDWQVTGTSVRYDVYRPLG